MAYQGKLVTVQDVSGQVANGTGAMGCSTLDACRKPVKTLVQTLGKASLTASASVLHVDEGLCNQ